ncbi:MAG TPA: dienelactone hydrolase family protein [Pyrinomonadaceae bacterium]|jgi:carboxymethylenebutenolidase
MIITSEYVDVPVAGTPFARTFVAQPRAAGKYPGVLCYSDIFQLTGPMLRACVRLAGYGFVVAAPEIYHRIEPPGMVIPFDDDGRTRGLSDASKTTVAQFDATARAVLDYLAGHARVAAGQLGVAGFCIGGHLAFRAACNRDVQATVCFYATGLHDGKLGQDADARSLARAADIRGELLLVWGTRDPHVPEAARAQIETQLQRAGTKFAVRLYDAEHAFMRDEGARYDPSATDEAWGEMVNLYRRVWQ